MSKLHRTESLESLISGGPVSNSRKHSSPTKVWILVTYINFFVLIATLIVAGSTLRMLHGISDESRISSQEHSLPSSSLDHPADTSQTSSSIKNWYTCGNTTEQAFQNGCVFDLMLSTWLHPECYWHEHSSTALDAANLTFYLDDDLTIPFYEAGSGDWPQHYIYTEPSYHALHCSYMWERQIMAWTSGDRIDTQCWNLGHTQHCAMTVLENNNPYPYKTARLRRGFSECGKP